MGSWERALSQRKGDQEMWGERREEKGNKKRNERDSEKDRARGTREKGKI